MYPLPPWIWTARGTSTVRRASVLPLAVLLFAAPASPLAQPWSVVGGNTLSTLVGVACVLLIPDPVAAAAVAVALAIAVMFALRCLHPPGGAAGRGKRRNPAPGTWVVHRRFNACDLWASA